ncbi:protein refolding chaperone Spy/CpxP family [Mariprofundus ferrinatatus]|uniref:Protein refolding chaperone Spy/CpxP family n=1 Tax=Mariprofundus ferrinatatus TaxID=1921087 RepID=A0A2K8LDY0_9PROT|nr:Spy/CpxP family protein refolding chaperone [Mariprofundus ferrinatatus]ATX82486.1 protein refolding chaperone Spy/CpxP family [Mariprofundus ferrinatatus]
MNEQKVMKRENGLRTVVFFVVASALFVAGANMAYAFGGPGGEKSMERRVERMAEKLDLSDSQRNQFKQIHEENRAEGRALHDAMHKNRQALRSLDPSAKDYSKQVARLASEKAELTRQMVIHRSEVRAEVHAMLTPEQQEKARQMKMDRKGKRFADGSGGEGRGHCK